MNTITFIAYLLACILIVTLTRAVIQVIRNNRQQKRILKQSRDLKAHRVEMRNKGYKEFSFGNGKVIIFAGNYKEANSQYQARKEMYNLKYPPPRKCLKKPNL